MYSEGLTTHPLKSGNRESIDDRLSLESMKKSLSLTEDMVEREERKISYINVIASEVNKSLWYPENNRLKQRNDFELYDLPYPLPLSTIREGQFTNCYGYTLVGSECLEKAGIEHWIAYTNKHAFLLVPAYEDKEKIYMVDMLSPVLNQYLGTATGRDLARSRSDFPETKKSATFLNTTLLTPNGEDIDYFAATHTWMKARKPESASNNELRFSHSSTSQQAEFRKCMSQYALVMSVFSVDEGRRALEKYVALQCALQDNDMEKAYFILNGMHGLFPDLDARQMHTELKRIVHYLTYKRRPDEAVKLVGEYFRSNFSLSNDSRFPTAQGDILRTIAKGGSYKVAAKLAINSYVEARDRSRSFNRTVTGKIAATIALQRELTMSNDTRN